MHRNVRAGVAPDQPLGKLPRRNRFRFEQRTVAVVDVLQIAIENVRPQLLMIRIEQLVVNDFRKHAVFVRKALEFVEFAERENRWFLDENVLTRRECRTCGAEMPVVRGGHTYHVDIAFRQLLGCIRAGEIREWRRRLPSILLGTATRAGGHRRQIDFHQPEVATV